MFCGDGRSICKYQDSVMVGWGKSKAGWFHKTYHNNIRGLSTSCGIALLVLLAIPCAAMVEAVRSLSEQNGYHQLAQCLHTINHNIFSSLEGGRWESAEMANMLKNLSTKEFHCWMKDTHLQNITTSILHGVISKRLQQAHGTSAIVDILGDHTSRVSEAFYARRTNDNMNPALANPSHFVQVSEVYRAIMGIEPFKDWDPVILKNPLLHFELLFSCANAQAQINVQIVL
jgi:hypothetical protein